ncbi:hypothetical protein NQ318_017111 [Aromia moschata]|uniref:Uncharacterized protein n=1 Tax=Aromia moschata TaxID=1265417 RepID=A0AAV8Y4Z1_9CUCU|nr:hypothetical protein NQ318_017111 [Aromia moschata]
MPIDLYYQPGSAPCRIVLLAAKSIGVELNLKRTDLRNKEHLTPEFLKLNPQHTIPTLVDSDGFSIWESRAIITYLQNKYGKDDSLYPKDPKKRAVVDQRLYFDATSLSPGARYAFGMFRGETLDPEKMESLKKTFTFLDTFLEGSEYVAGDHYTLADISIVLTVSTLATAGYDLSPYKNITRWYAKIQKTLPGYEDINTKALAELKEMIRKGPPK